MRRSPRRYQRAGTGTYCWLAAGSAGLHSHFPHGNFPGYYIKQDLQIHQRSCIWTSCNAEAEPALATFAFLKKSSKLGLCQHQGSRLIAAGKVGFTSTCQLILQGKKNEVNHTCGFAFLLLLPPCPGLALLYLTWSCLLPLCCMALKSAWCSPGIPIWSGSPQLWVISTWEMPWWAVAPGN